MDAIEVILALLAQGWPLTPKMAEEIEHVWPMYQLRLQRGTDGARFFGFTQEPSCVTVDGLRLSSIGIASRANFWYDWPHHVRHDLANIPHVIIHDGYRLCIPEYAEVSRG